MGIPDNVRQGCVAAGLHATSRYSRPGETEYRSPTGRNEHSQCTTPLQKRHGNLVAENHHHSVASEMVRLDQSVVDVTGNSGRRHLALQNRADDTPDIPHDPGPGGSRLFPVLPVLDWLAL